MVVILLVERVKCTVGVKVTPSNSNSNETAGSGVVLKTKFVLVPSRVPVGVSSKNCTVITFDVNEKLLGPPNGSKKSISNDPDGLMVIGLLGKNLLFIRP